MSLGPGEGGVLFRFSGTITEFGLGEGWLLFKEEMINGGFVALSLMTDGGTAGTLFLSELDSSAGPLTMRKDPIKITTKATTIPVTQPEPSLIYESPEAAINSSRLQYLN